MRTLPVSYTHLATVSYLEALKQYELDKVKQNAYENIRQLADSDSVRFTLGKIMEIDAIQSRLEAGILKNELLQAETDLHNAFSNLNLLTGSVASIPCTSPMLHCGFHPVILCLLI